MRDIIKKYPKLRGYKFASIEVKPQPVNLAAIEIHFADGDTVSPVTLAEKKVVRKQAGRLPAVKILATGTLTKKVTVSGCVLSETAKAAIEKAGGKVVA
jgi:large subunit ribosomal protein L15